MRRYSARHCPSHIQISPLRKQTRANAHIEGVHLGGNEWIVQDDWTSNKRGDVDVGEIAGRGDKAGGVSMILVQFHSRVGGTLDVARDGDRHILVDRNSIVI